MGFRDLIGKFPATTLSAERDSDSERQARALEVLVRFKARQTPPTPEPTVPMRGRDSRRYSTCSDSALLRRQRNLVERHTANRTSSTSLPEMSLFTGAELSSRTSSRLSDSHRRDSDTTLAKLRAKISDIHCAVKARMHTSDQDLSTCGCDVSASHVKCDQSKHATSMDSRVVTVVVGEFRSETDRGMYSACPCVDLSSRISLVSLSNGRCTTEFSIAQTRNSEKVFVNIRDKHVELCCEHTWECSQCNVLKNRVCKVGFARLPLFLDTSTLQLDYDEARNVIKVSGNVESPFNPKVKTKVTRVKFDKKTIAKRHIDRARTGGVVMRKMYDTL